MTSRSAQYGGVHALGDLFVLDKSERILSLLMPVQILNAGLTIRANGYLDETEGDDIVGVGGWLGTFETWHEFERRWLDLLPKEANGDFHYTDFWYDPTHWSKSWSHEKRLDFIKHLAMLVIQHASIGLGIVISRSEYERIVPIEDQNQFRGAVYFCLGHCLRLLLEHYETLPSKPPKPLLFMHDSKKGKEEWIAGWYYSVRNRFAQEGILGTLAFGTRSSEPVLQAADLLVGELRRHRQGHPSQVVEILRQKQNILVAFPTEKELRDHVNQAVKSIQ